jgi:hypothetical protein
MTDEAIETAHWSQVGAEWQRQPLELAMFKNEGFRAIHCCYLSWESRQIREKKQRVVIYDWLFVKKQIGKAVLRPLGVDNLETLTKLIVAAEKREQEKIKAELLSRK